MKIESRGKYAGVKIHLDADECVEILKIDEEFSSGSGKVQELPLSLRVSFQFGALMKQKINGLLKKEPDLLHERTPEQIAAILAKESEKAAMQLNAIKSGKQWQKVDPAKLEQALLKHAK